MLNYKLLPPALLLDFLYELGRQGQSHQMLLKEGFGVGSEGKLDKAVKENTAKKELITNLILKKCEKQLSTMEEPTKTGNLNLLKKN